MFTRTTTRKQFTAKRRRADQKERRYQGKRARLLCHEPLEDRRLLAVAPMSAFVFGLSETGGGAFSDDIAVDEQGNTYVTGVFVGADVDFGPGNLLSSSADSEDIFVAKHDPGGNLAWVQTIGGNNQDRPNGIDVDSVGNVYLTGNVSGEVQFGDQELRTPSDHRGHFVTKLSSNGEFLWTTQMWDAQDGNTTGMDVVIDDGGTALYTTGSKATSRWAATIARLNPDDGSVEWNHLIPTSPNGYSRGYSLDTDNYGNVYLGGIFDGQIDVGGMNLKAIKNGQDVFLTRFDPEGSFQWANRMGGPEPDNLYGIDVHSNSVVASGYFKATADFGSVTLTSHGESDVFLMKTDTDTGNVSWAKGFGGADTDHANDVAIDVDGNVFVTGDFRGVADFDPNPSVAVELQEVGQYGDAFVSQFHADGSFANVWQIGGVPTDIGEGIVADSAGNVYATGRASRGAEFPTGLVTPEYGVTAYVMRLGEVDPNNTPPTANDDLAVTAEDTSITIDVLANDDDPDPGDVIQVSAITQGANGSVSNISGLSVTYAPDPDFNGTDTFTYTISDGRGGTDTATVTVTVTAVPDPPVAVDDSDSTTVGSEVDIAVLTNDSDPDGDVVSIISFTQGTAGTVTDNGDGTLKYTSTGTVATSDIFTYTITDGDSTTPNATANVAIDVQEIPSSLEYSSTGGAMTIRDKKTVSSPIDVSGTGLFVDTLTVRINLTHANPGDLTAQLVSPTGLTLDLPGPIVSDDYGHTYDVSGMAGEPVDGTWTLKVTDHTRDKQQGELIEWTMTVAVASPAMVADAALMALSETGASDDDDSDILMQTIADDLALLMME